MKTALILTLLSSPAFAQAVDWNVRPWDTQMSRDQAVDAVTGQTFVFVDGGKAVYGDDGTYAYIYGNGNTYDGDYSFADDGSICVTFDNGTARCDYFVMQDNRFVLITENGGRYPVE